MSECSLLMLSSKSFYSAQSYLGVPCILSLFLCMSLGCSNLILLHVIPAAATAAAPPPHCVAKQDVSVWPLILFLSKQDKVDSDKYSEEN